MKNYCKGVHVRFRSGRRHRLEVVVLSSQHLRSSPQLPWNKNNSILKLICIQMQLWSLSLRTSPTCVVVLQVDFRVSQRYESKVGDFEHEATVDDAIGRLQVSVNLQLARMNKCHSLRAWQNRRAIEFSSHLQYVPIIFAYHILYISNYRKGKRLVYLGAAIWTEVSVQLNILPKKHKFYL